MHGGRFCGGGTVLGCLSASGNAFYPTCDIFLRFISVRALARRHSSLAASPGSELTYVHVVDVWRQRASAWKMSTAESDAIARWLRRVLSRPHRRIDEESLNNFRDALDHFAVNSRADITSPVVTDESLNLLRFCCDVGWSTPKRPAEVADQYATFAAEMIERVKKIIEDSLPADKKAKWEPKVTAAITRVRVDVDHHVRALCDDMLFPAFKGDLADVTRKLRYVNVDRSYGDHPSIRRRPADDADAR